MKFKDIKELSGAELKKKFKTIKSDLFQAKMKNSLGQYSNPVEIRFLRRDVARLMTAMNAKAVKGGSVDKRK